HLKRQLWDDDTFVDFEQGLNTCVRQIRLALGDTADAPRYIQTLQRRGYRFVAHVDVVPRPAAATIHGRDKAPQDREPKDEGLRTEGSRDSGPEDEGPKTGELREEGPGDRTVNARRPWLTVRGRRRKYAAAALFVVISGTAMSRAVVSRLSPSAPPGIRSVAVLPLANLSATADTDYLADGLTEAL